MDKHLQYRGFDASLATPEEYDVLLRARTERANTWCRQRGKRNVCLVSIHTNAAGNGKPWMNARGLTRHTSRVQTAGYRLADCRYAPLRSGSPVTSFGWTTPKEIPAGRATCSS